MAVGCSRFKNAENDQYLDMDLDGNLFTSEFNSELDSQVWQFICNPNGNVLFQNMSNDIFLSHSDGKVAALDIKSGYANHIWDWKNDNIIFKENNKLLTLNSDGKLVLEEANGSNSQRWISC